MKLGMNCDLKSKDNLPLIFCYISKKAWLHASKNKAAIPLGGKLLSETSLKIGFSLDL